MRWQWQLREYGLRWRKSMRHPENFQRYWRSLCYVLLLVLICVVVLRYYYKQALLKQQMQSVTHQTPTDIAVPPKIPSYEEAFPTTSAPQVPKKTISGRSIVIKSLSENEQQKLEKQQAQGHQVMQQAIRTAPK